MTRMILQVLLNKFALSSKTFSYPVTLVLTQCLVSVVLVGLVHLVKSRRIPPITISIVSLWLPMSLIFSSMIASSSMALQRLDVATSNVLKSLTNVLILLAEYILFGRTYNNRVRGCVGLIIASAVAASWTSVSMNPSGILFQGINCCFTAANWVYLKYVYLKGHMTSNQKVRRKSRVESHNSVRSLSLGRRDQADTTCHRLLQDLHRQTAHVC